MCQLGCIVAYKRKEHICITILTDSLPKKVKPVIHIIARIITFIALVFLAYGSIPYVKISSEYINAGIPINYGIIICVVLIMSFSMVFCDLLDLFQFIKKHISSGNNSVVEKQEANS
jgi:TRAP-type C4-dicarboxylate transport system permease small subunit